MATSAAVSSSAEEEPPPPKKAKTETPDQQRKKLFGLVDHNGEPLALPADWVAVPHVSGATVYLHQPTRVVTLSRPYHVSTSKTIRKHRVYVESVPCLEQWLYGESQSELARSWLAETEHREKGLHSVGPEKLTQYLALCWDRDLLAESSELHGQAEEERKKLTKKPEKKPSVVIPEGLSKVVKVKVPVEYRKMVEHPEGRRPPAIWQVNMTNKKSVNILYEFCQVYLHSSPSFIFSTKGPPYQCEVKVGRVTYGTGKGASKKIAKFAAAAEAMELFLPGSFPQLAPTTDTHPSSTSEESLQLLSGLPLEDPGAPAILAQTGFPTPWQTFRHTLQWNKGFVPDKVNLDLQPLSEERSHASSLGHQFECVLKCGEEGVGECKGVMEVRVTCAGRRDGQQAAAQAMLKKIHPYITNWGSLLKLYSHRDPLPREPELPPSSVAKGCGLLSGADQMLLERLRESMAELARERALPLPSLQEHSLESVAETFHRTHTQLLQPHSNQS